MSSSSSLTDLRKLVKVTSTSASLTYIAKCAKEITIENDEGYQLHLMVVMQFIV